MQVCGYECISVWEHECITTGTCITWAWVLTGGSGGLFMMHYQYCRPVCACVCVHAHAHERACVHACVHVCVCPIFFSPTQNDDEVLERVTYTHTVRVSATSCETCETCATHRACA